AEKVPVCRSGSLARLQVPTPNSERAVSLGTEGGLALAVWRLQVGGVHLVLTLVPPVTSNHALAGEFPDLGHRSPGYNVDLPRLDVRSRWSPSGRKHHALQHVFRHRLVGEIAHRPSGSDCFIDVHDRTSENAAEESSEPGFRR